MTTDGLLLAWQELATREGDPVTHMVIRYASGREASLPVPAVEVLRARVACQATPAVEVRAESVPVVLPALPPVSRRQSMPRMMSMPERPPTTSPPPAPKTPKEIDLELLAELDEAGRDAFDLLSTDNRRFSYRELHAALDAAGCVHSESAVYRACHHLVELGLADSKSDARGKGYGRAMQD